MASWTQRETMHLMGDGYSHMAFVILKDGDDIGIVREISTSGRPEFRKTRDVITCGEQAFDALAEHQRGDFAKWLDDILHTAELRKFDQELAAHAGNRRPAL